jgi:sugar lactone lactonase YvrE
MEDAMTSYAEGLVWGEAPRWQGNGLWVSDTQGSALWTDTSGTWTRHPLESPSNGLWVTGEGQLLAAMMHEKRIGRWSGSAFETHADLSTLVTGPLGDMIGDDHGNLYVDDVGFAMHLVESPRPGQVVLVRPTGEAEVAAADVEFPNGLALIDGGRSLVLAETSAQRLIKFTVNEDGTLGDRSVYADIRALLGEAARPDGLWPAKAGGVWVATTFGHSVARVGPARLEQEIDLAPDFPIACCETEDRLLVTVAATDGMSLMDAIKEKAVRTRVEALALAAA